VPSKTSSLMKKTKAIVDFIDKEKLVEGLNGNYPKEDAFNTIFDCLMKEQTGKLIYCLYKFKFSNKYELKRYTSLSKSSVTHFMDKFWKYAMYDILSRRDGTYRLLMNFWQYEHKNGHKKGIFYYINPNFISVIEAFEDILRYHFAKRDLVLIEKRTAKWLNHQERIEQQAQAQKLFEKSSIGKCEICSTLILADSIEGKHYFNLG